MNSGLMTIHHNDPDNFIDKPEDFSQYHRSLLCEHEFINIQTSITQVRNTQLDGGSNSHLFSNITIFTYTRPEKCNVKITNGRKSPAKGLGTLIIRVPITNIIIPLWPSYYIPQTPQNAIIQTTLKHYNEFIRVRNEALRWLKVTIDTRDKIKFDTESKERDKQLLFFITIEIIEVCQKIFRTRHHHFVYDSNCQ